MDRRDTVIFCRPCPLRIFAGFMAGPAAYPSVSLEKEPK